MTKFFKYGDRNPKPLKMDIKNITLTKAGKTYNVYDAIQAANVDTDIYEVMKKYHCVADEAVQYMQERGGEKGVYMDIRELQKQVQDIGNIHDIARKAQEMFDALPTEVKSKYGDNLDGFMQEMQKKYNKENEPEPQNLEKNEVKTNETK